MRLNGLDVVVTGASSGIGRATAELLAFKGARVAAVARSAGALDELAAGQPGIVPVVADLATDDGRAAVADRGPVDVLVNNAGLGWIGQVDEMPADQVRKLFELNVLALIDLTQRVLPGMLERKRGHVVNVASVASWVSIPPLTVYSATKFAVQGFSDGLRREVGGRGVRVTTVNPGPVATRFGHRAMFEDPLTDDMGEGRMGGVPASMAAQAVARAIRRGGLPGYTSIAVPRVLGFVRLGALPGLRFLSDSFAVGFRGVRASNLRGR
ncbi:MAG TPA: SDR family NAD(P)-dependent oxidoreductase [Acidimicrobiales bacterium]|nr:SDR family NAD(P)-dependent oxidoreductase [Acidimicrobiales bacterium]